MKIDKEELVYLSRRNAATFLQTLPSKIPSAKHFKEADIEYIYSGFKSCFLNSIVGGNPADEDFDEIAFKIVAYYAANGASCSWWMSKAHDMNMNKAFEKMYYYGFDDMTVLKGMMLNFERFEKLCNGQKKLTIAEVDDADAFKDYISVYSSFANSAEVQNQIISYYTCAATQKAYLSGGTKYFVGYFGQTPVTIGSLCFDGDTVGVYDIFTLQSEQRKGYAREFVSELLGYAQKADCDLCILQSSEVAINLYLSFGFEAFEDFFVLNNTKFMNKFGESIVNRQLADG